MKIKGIRVWPWHLIPRFRSFYFRWGAILNKEGGITVKIAGHYFYTSDRAEGRHDLNA